MKPAILYRTSQATETRVEILRVAMDVASAEGLEGLSIGRLAAEMHMSKTGIFSHFGSKQELQLATIEAAKRVFAERVVAPSFESPRGIPRLGTMLSSWLDYVEKIVFRGGCFFAAASAEFDSRPGPVRDQIASLTRVWLTAIEDEINFAKSTAQIQASVNAAQLGFELHAYVQEANWAFKLFDEKSAFRLARRAIADRIRDVSADKNLKTTPKGVKR